MRALIACVFLIGALGPGASAQNVSTLIASHPDLNDYLAFSPSGTLYIANQQDKISRLGEFGQVMPFVTGLTAATGLAFAPDGTLYASDSSTGEVLKITTLGEVSVFASGLVGDGSIGPVGLVFDQDENLYVSVYDGTVRRIAPNGTMATLAAGGDLAQPAGLAIDETGTLYAADFFSGKVVSISPAGTQTLLATVPGWVGYITYAGGALYATGYNTHVIYRITLDGAVSILAGSGEQGQNDGVGTAATFSIPNGITVDPSGTRLYVTSDGVNGSLRTIDGLITETAAEPEHPFRGYTLEANHPNPFRHTTTLSFSLPVPDAVTLTLHDLLGRRINVLAREPYPSGSHTVTLDAGTLSQGTYLYTLSTARGYTATRRMVHIGR